MIYTHDEAMLIVEMFEDILNKNNICIPSPEDDERSQEDMIGLYGSVYSDLLDSVEDKICEILERYINKEVVVCNVFSGDV